MTIAPSMGACAPLPTVDATSLMPVLTQLTQTLGALIPVLQARAAATGGGAAAAGCAQGGAAQISGGGQPAQVQPAGGGCGCGGMGAASGQGALGAPKASAWQGRGAKGGGANGAPAAKATSSTTSGKGGQAVDLVKKELGKPYKWGASGPSSYDCSGLMLAVYKQLGISLPHKASEQAKQGRAVDKKDLQPGDLVFFDAKGSGIHHVGMYIGGGKMIHAPRTGKNIEETDITSGYYADALVSARRLV